MPEIAKAMKDLVTDRTDDTHLAGLVHKAISKAYLVGGNRALEDAAVELSRHDGAEWALAGVHAGQDAAAMVRARKVPVDPPPADGIHVNPVRFRVSCLPETHETASHLTVFVEYRGRDLWAVTWPGKGCLSRSGEWHYEPVPSERTDEWLAEHRFPYPEAVRLARQVAPLLTVNGLTVTDVLEEH